MALRLGEYVVYGELRNLSHYSTHGIIVLRGEAPGQETVLRVELTGDCDRDLRGKCFRFSPSKDNKEKAVFRKEDYRGLQQGQIGPTGTMTAQGWVRTLPCSVAEFMRRSELGEPPPTAWKRHLYLEWYSQNRRVVVEMADPVVEECIRQPKGDDDEGEWQELPNLALPPEFGKTAPGPEITMIHQDGDDVHIETFTPSHPAGEEEDDVSPYAALDRHFEAEASAVDRATRGEGGFSDEMDSNSDMIRELKLMDDCIEHGQRQPPFLLLDGTDRLPRPDDLDDKQVEAELKNLLAQLALRGIALDVCEHFTPRDCYRLLVDKILLEPHAYTELVGTGWVQHISTWEYCAKCEAEGKLAAESDSA